MNRVLGRFAAQMAAQVEDLGFQAVLEKMNSLNAPQFSGPFGNISKSFEKNWLICQSSLPREIQLKLTLALRTWYTGPALRKKNN